MTVGPAGCRLLAGERGRGGTGSGGGRRGGELLELAADVGRGAALGLAGSDPVGDVAFVGQARQLEDTDLAGDAGEAGAGGRGVMAAGGIVVGDDHHPSAAQGGVVGGPPLAGAAGIGGAGEAEGGESVGVLLALDEEDAGAGADGGPRLVVIDSVMSFVGARTDVYRPNEVRAVLAPLAKLAEAYGCAILALRHITKSKGGRAIYAGQGSIDFTAAARSVLLAGSSPQDPDEHALLHIKSNLSALGQPLGYRLGESGFAWTGESRLTAADLLAAETAGEERAAGEEASIFLRELLAERPLPARKVFEEAKKAGISEITLRRAKAREGVVAQRIGFQDGAQWLWSIPATSPRRS